MEDSDARPRKSAKRDVVAQMVEAGSSVTMGELVVSNPRLECTQQKRSIFLSHSGVQKAFVRRVRIALERNAYHPFFDEDPDSLPKGEPFAHRIKDACRQVDVAVVVLSDEFLTSKWPMIELAIFIKEQSRRRSLPECKELKILPLFMGFSVEEFRNIDKQTHWQDKWNEMRVRDNRINVFEWEEALKVLGGINGLEYCRYRNEEEYIDSIVSEIFKLVPPDLKWEDAHMKGKSKFHQAVADTFARAPSRTKFLRVRAIGLYGVGGIGKTTLCKSLCNDYFAEFNGKVWHVELGKKSADQVQKDVLRHLVGTSETLLNHSEKCKDQWQTLLQRQINYKVFLAIDNVWNEDVSRVQAESLLKMGFHPDSLVIITSRSRELLEWMGIHKECCLEMPMLCKDDATEILLVSAVPGFDIQSITYYQRAAVEMVVERCFMTKGPISSVGSEKQYVPLALAVLGRQLRLPLDCTAEELANWVNSLDLKWPNQKQHPLFSVLRLSYDNLPSSKHRSIFLDVALCVPRQQDNTSASVNEVWKWLSMVYYNDDVDAILRILQDLQRDGLVEKWQSPASLFGMHELYSEFAKLEAAKELNFDEQHYLYHEDGRSVPALMRWFPRHNYLPLKRIHIYNGGFKELSRKELRFMANVEVLKLDFCFELESLDLRCLESLRSLELRGCFSLQLVAGLDDLKNLIFFRWNTCRNSIVTVDFPQALEVVEIYGSKGSKVYDIGSFGGCIELLELTLSHHPVLAAVSDLSKLHKLQKMDLSGCCSIEEVRGLGGLIYLRHLNLENCKKLRSCDGLEKLVEIQTLNLGGCEGIRLSELLDLSGLIILRSINISGILVVRRLVLGSSQLEQLEVVGCRDLRTVAVSWKFLNRFNEQRIREPRQWTVEFQSVVDRNLFDTYESLNLSNCHTLESLGDMGLLTSLKFLYLQNCSMLKTVPNLRDAPYLEVVDLSYCCILEDLGDVGPLRALQHLYLQNCGSFKSLGDLTSPCLKVLDLSNCPSLMDLGNFDSLSSLQMLNLNECVSLRTVPSLTNSPLLEVLNLKGCVALRSLSHMATLNVVIDISKCWSLERIAILTDLDRLELDVSVGDDGSQISENMAHPVSFGNFYQFPKSGILFPDPNVLSLKLTCQRDSSTSQCSGVEMWKERLEDKIYSEEDQNRKNHLMKMLTTAALLAPGLWEMLWFRKVNSGKEHLADSTSVSLDSIEELLESIDKLIVSGALHSWPPVFLESAPEIKNGFGLIKSCSNGILHFKDIVQLLSLADWERSSAVEVPRLSRCFWRTQVKFSFISVSGEKLTTFPCSAFLTTVSRLEFIECGRLRNLSHLKYLPALETLVISQCAELERLPDLNASLKHLTIRDFRRGPKFQFLSHLCQPCHAYPKKWAPCYFKNLVELNFDGCVGLGGLANWGTMPSLESLVIKDCNTIIQLPDLRRSSKLSKVVVLQCGKFKKALDVGFGETLRMVRIEECGNEKLGGILSREELIQELKNVQHQNTEVRIKLGISELIKWLREGEREFHLDMFSGLDFSKFQFTGQTLETFNTLMAKWAQLSTSSGSISSS